MPPETDSGDAVPPAGDRGAQPEAVEDAMVAALAAGLGVSLEPRQIPLRDGGRLEIDAANDDLSVLCEVRADQGPMTPAQRNEVLADAFKLSVAGRAVGGAPRLILLFSDSSAMAPFVGTGWPASGLRGGGIETILVELA